jgi:hypothetical protein
MTIIYAVVQQFGCIRNGPVSSTTVPRYALSFFSTKELVDAYIEEFGNNDEGFLFVKEVTLDDYQWQIVIDPTDG